MRPKQSYVIKRKEGTSIVELLLQLLLLINLSMLVYYPAYARFNGSFNTIITVISVLIIISRTAIEFTAMKLIGSVIFFSLSAIAIVLNHSGFGVMLQFLWPLAIIFMFMYSDLSEKYLSRMSLLMLAAWLISIVASYRNITIFFVNAKKGIHTDGLNPNTVAIVIASTALFVQAYLERMPEIRWLKWFVALISIIGIYNTKSRTSLVAFLLVTALDMLFKHRLNDSRQHSVALTGAIIAIGVLFPIVYVFLFSGGMITTETTFMGKSLLTGRQYIWISLWGYIQKNPGAVLWGVGYNTDLYLGGTFNVHNAYLQLFAQYGLPIFVMYFSFLLYIVSSMFGTKDRINDLQFKCYQVILLTLCIGYGETILSFIPTIIFIALACGIGFREAEGGKLS